MNQSKIKSDVLNEIAAWADGMSMDRIKRKKQPQAQMEMPAEPEAAPQELAEEMPMGEPEEMMSLEELLKLEQEYK